MDEDKKTYIVDRFTLKNNIMDCWSILNDIETYREKYELCDAQDNFMLGLKSIYGVKFEVLFDTFETLIKQGQCK